MSKKKGIPEKWTDDAAATPPEETPPVETPPVETAQAATPPGRVGSRGHGLGEPAVTAFGVARLRDVLSLSADVGIERVCDDAAAAIERLRNQVPAKD